MAATLLNIDKWISGGFTRVQWAVSSSGRPYDTSNAPSAGNGVGMTILYGATSANVNFPQAEILQVPGDDGVRGAIQFAGNQLPSFDLTFADLNLPFIDSVQGTTEIDLQSTFDLGLLDPANRSFPDVFLMFTRRAVSTVAGSEGNGYETLIMPLCTVGFQSMGQFQTGANAGQYTFNVTLNRVSKTPYGQTLSTGTHGTTAVSAFFMWSTQIPTFDVYIQDNSTTTYAPTQAMTVNGNDSAIAWDGTLAGTPATLAITVANNPVDFTFTAQTSGNVTTFLYEVAA